tara:strand:+ start:585 stop:1229 length:645 start_codon:yes stop_codon:yes gene_type:complete
MPREKKYVKLEAGERKAARQGGAMKRARGGVLTNIYSGEKGGLWNDRNPKSTVPEPTTRSKSTPAVDVKRQAGSAESKVYNREQYIKQGSINQSEFDKTRLGSRIVKKATKSVARDERKGKDVEFKKLQLENKIRTAPQPGDKGLAPGRVKRGTVTFNKQKKQEEKKQVLTKQEKSTARYQAKAERAKTKTERQSARNEAAGMRKDARVAKRNS